MIQASLGRDKLSFTRIAILGMGNELRGDDAAGCLVVRNLQKLDLSPEVVLLVDAGLAPENFTGVLRRFRPDLVLLIDAGSFGASPGSIGVFSPQELVNFSSSTHTLSPHLLATYLQSEIGCEIRILAIQPASLEFSANVSGPVTNAVTALTAELSDFLNPTSPD